VAISCGELPRTPLRRTSFCGDFRAFGAGKTLCPKTPPCSIGKSRHRRRTRPPHVRAKRRPRCGEDGEQRGRGEDPRWARGGAKPPHGFVYSVPDIRSRGTPGGTTHRREAHEVRPNVLPLPPRRWQPGRPEGRPGPNPTRIPAPGTQGPPATGASPPKTRRGRPFLGAGNRPDDTQGRGATLWRARYPMVVFARSHPKPAAGGGPLPHRTPAARGPSAGPHGAPSPRRAPLTHGRYVPCAYSAPAARKPEKFPKNVHLAYTKFAKDWPPSRGHEPPFPILCAWYR
jgi:hypothetical protein